MGDVELQVGTWDGIQHKNPWVVNTILVPLPFHSRRSPVAPFCGALLRPVPLSPILANLNMEYFETDIFPYWNSQPLLGLRYIDYIFVVWPDDQNFSRLFLPTSRICSFKKVFRGEERHGMLPFLDIKVIHNNIVILFNVFRNEIHTSSYMHWLSYHPTNVQRGSLFLLFLRAHRKCDESYIASEMNFIGKSFLKLG